jgi:hypothetical protein
MNTPFDRDDWESWEVRFDDGRRGDDFRGYDRWKSDVGAWPSVGDDDRPTNPEPRRSFWEDLVIDLTAEEADRIPDSSSAFLDLADDVVDVVDDVEDRTV